MEDKAKWQKERKERLRLLEQKVAEDNFGKEPSQSERLKDEVEVLKNVKAVADKSNLDLLEKSSRCLNLQERVKRQRRLHVKQEKEKKRLRDEIKKITNRNIEDKKATEIIERGGRVTLQMRTEMIINHNNYMYRDRLLQNHRKQNLDTLKIQVSKKLASMENFPHLVELKRMRKQLMKKKIMLMQLKREKLDMLNMLRKFDEISIIRRNSKILKFASNMVKIQDIEQKGKLVPIEETDTELRILSQNKENVESQNILGSTDNINYNEDSSTNVLAENNKTEEEFSKIFDKFKLPVSVPPVNLSVRRQKTPQAIVSPRNSAETIADPNTNPLDSINKDSEKIGTIESSASQVITNKTLTKSVTNTEVTSPYFVKGNTNETRSSFDLISTAVNKKKCNRYEGTTACEPLRKQGRIENTHFVKPIIPQVPKKTIQPNKPVMKRTENQQKQEKNKNTKSVHFSEQLIQDATKPKEKARSIEMNFDPRKQNHHPVKSIDDEQRTILPIRQTNEIQSHAQNHLKRAYEPNKIQGASKEHFPGNSEGIDNFLDDLNSTRGSDGDQSLTSFTGLQFDFSMADESTGKQPDSASEYNEIFGLF